MLGELNEEQFDFLKSSFDAGISDVEGKIISDLQVNLRFRRSGLSRTLFLWS